MALASTLTSGTSPAQASSAEEKTNSRPAYKLKPRPPILTSEPLLEVKWNTVVGQDNLTTDCSRKSTYELRSLLKDKAGMFNPQNWGKPPDWPKCRPHTDHSWLLLMEHRLWPKSTQWGRSNSPPAHVELWAAKHQPKAERAHHIDLT